MLLFKKIKWWFQRRYRGYADCDLWDLDYFLGTFIIKILKDFKNKNEGIPHNFTDEAWDKKIDTMIEGFNFLIKEPDIDFKFTEEEYLEAKEKAMNFITYFDYLWY